MRFARFFVLWIATSLCPAALGQSSVRDVEVGLLRGESACELADRSMRDFTRQAFELSSGVRASLAKGGRYHPQIPFSLPGVVRLKGFGVPLRTAGPFSRGGGITLSFDASGPRAFPAGYRQQLQDVFAESLSTLNAVFGPPAWNATIHVRNYDADIGDRHAVSGGYFVPDNGIGEPEIRFPVYSSPEAAAVNFVHCLLLAYLGPNAYFFDAFQEGLVRAATMRVARTPGALPAQLDPEIVTQVLENTYDAGPHYDWFNQRALGGARFIAPNLVSPPLPTGGSLGGIYLLRYLMAGSAWQKVLTQYPGFIAAFNQAFYADPGIAGNVPALVSLGQGVIDGLAGQANSPVEGRLFADWFRRQFVLETGETRGLKLFVLPTPIPPFGPPDFGVFDVAAIYFETLAGGNETLLSGVSFPIFWTATYDRLFPSSQEDRMDIAGSYGSVTPNLPDMHGGDPYRCTVDIPVQDRLQRVYLPAGGVATSANPTPNDFYGTVVGVPGGVGVTMRVRLTAGLTVHDNIPIRNNAFGARIDTPNYLGYRQLRVEVIRTVGGNDTVVIDRRVNKGPGPLGLDLRLNDGDLVFNPVGGLPKGLSTISVPLEPLRSLMGAVLAIPEEEVLAARWNASRARYDIYPDCGPIFQGGGFFLRMNVANPGFGVTGRTSPGVPISVALRPGWNFVATPLNELVPTSRVSVLHAANFPEPFDQALGGSIGTDFFEFVPGANDAATGAPETGTFVPATSFVPGKAYFVRAMTAEGVSLAFFPAPPATAIRLSPTAASRSSTPSGGWLMKVTVSEGAFRTWALIGQSWTATAGFDPSEDSELPPSMGGFQIQSTNVTPMFRDMRTYRLPTAYRLRVGGLRVGKTYTVRTEFMRGALSSYWFRDLTRVFPTRLTGNATYTFTANSAVREFEVRVTRESW